MHPFEMTIRRGNRRPFLVTLRAAILGALLVGSSVYAASSAPVMELKPAAIPGLEPGKVVVLEGVTGKEEDRFNLPNLSIFQPVAISLVAKEKSEPLNLKLGKFNWDEDFQGGSTAESGQYIARFRTQGDLLISVNSSSPGSRYSLAVWVGDETKPEMEPVLVAPSAANGGAQPLPWAWIGGAAALVGVAFVIGVKRGRGHAS